MRKLAILAGFFAAGVVLDCYFLPEIYQLPLALTIFAAAGILFLANKRRHIFLLTIGLGVGIFYAWAYGEIIREPAMEHAGRLYPGVSMEVCDWPESTAYGAKVTVRIGDLGKAVYYGEESILSAAPGDVLTDDVYLSDASAIDGKEVTTFSSRGIWLLAYSRGEAELMPGGMSLRHLPLYLKRSFQEQIQRLFDEESAAMMLALLTGDRSQMPEDITADLEESGLYHVTAVSGLHCTILLGAVVFIAGKQRRRVACIAMPVLLLYMLMVGCTPSVVRAVIMSGCLLAAPIFRRDGDPPTALAFALLLILLQNPFAVTSISLQLSFAAVAGILLITPRLWTKKGGKVFRFVAGSFAATAGALVFTIPLSAYYFNFFVLVAPLSNLLCLWAVTYEFGLGLAAVIVSYILFPVGQILAFASAGFGWYVLRMAHLMASVPYHALYFDNGYLKYWLAFAYAAFGICAAARSGRRRYLLCAGLCAGTLILTVQLSCRQMSAGKVDIFALDVGQGQSVLMVSDGQTALIDCGSANSFLDPGGIAADRILTVGERELDYLILTHYDSDHINGVEKLLSRVEVGTIFLPDLEGADSVEDLASAHGIPVEYVLEKNSYGLGQAELTVYPPVGDGDGNEAGLTAVCTCENFDFVVTGDMDMATERKLIASADLPDAEVMMVGHHGSKNSTSTDLLEALSPEAAIISVGDNSYGHPAYEALRRLVIEGTAVYRSDMQGTIHISVN